MSLFSRNSGVIIAISGDDATHRRLVDMGLLGARYVIRHKRGSLALADISCGGQTFSVSFGASAEKLIAVEGENENSALRQPKRRKDDAL